MKPKPERSNLVDYLTKLFITVGFFAIFFIFIGFETANGKNLESISLSTSDLVLLCFATLRMGRLISFDLILEPLRQPFTRTVKDVSGAGSTVLPKGNGVQRAIGQLISCPVCTATWAGAALVLAMYLWPGPARLFVTILGVVGVAEVLNSLIETLSWSGFLSRSRAGDILREHRQDKSE